MSCPTFWVSSTQFRKERTYLRAASPKTDAWCGTAFKAFQAAPGEGFSKRMQAFVVSLRERGIKPRSVNTYLQCSPHRLAQEAHDLCFGEPPPLFHSSGTDLISPCSLDARSG